MIFCAVSLQSFEFVNVNELNLNRELRQQKRTSTLDKYRITQYIYSLSVALQHQQLDL
jgi:hypothetical protein